MKIAMLSLSTPNMEEGHISFPNKAAYCARHGYDFIPAHETLCPERHPSWSKILMLLGKMDEYDLLFWTDADSLICNPDIKIETIVGDSDADLHISAGRMGLNAGQFIIKSGLPAERFLSLVWDTFPPGGPWWEQSAMIDLIDAGRADLKINMVHKREINSFPGDFRADHFMLHWPGDPGRVPKMAARAWVLEIQGRAKLAKTS